VSQPPLPVKSRREAAVTQAKITTKGGLTKKSNCHTCICYPKFKVKAVHNNHAILSWFISQVCYLEIKLIFNTICSVESSSKTIKGDHLILIQVQKRMFRENTYSYRHEKVLTKWSSCMNGASSLSRPKKLVIRNGTSSNCVHQSKEGNVRQNDYFK